MINRSIGLSRSLKSIIITRAGIFRVYLDSGRWKMLIYSALALIVLASGVVPTS